MADKDTGRNLETVIGESESKRIIFIDSPKYVKKVRDTFEKETGYDVLYFGNAKKAMGVFEEFQPDMVFIGATSNIGMKPLELAKEIKEAKPNTGVVLMPQAPVTDDQINKAEEDGIISLVRKPFEGSELIPTIKRFYDTRSKETPVLLIYQHNEDKELARRKLIQAGYTVRVAHVGQMPANSESYLQIDMSGWEKPVWIGRARWQENRRFFKELDLTQLSLREIQRVAKLIPSLKDSNRETYESIVKWTRDVTVYNEEQEIVSKYIDALRDLQHEKGAKKELYLPIEVVKEMEAKFELIRNYLAKKVAGYKNAGDKTPEGTLKAKIVDEILHRNELRYFLNTTSEADAYSFLRKEDLKNLPSQIGMLERVIDVSDDELTEYLLEKEIKNKIKNLMKSEEPEKLDDRYKDENRGRVAAYVREAGSKLNKIRGTLKEKKIAAAKRQLEVMGVLGFINEEHMVPVGAIHHIFNSRCDLGVAGSWVKTRKVYSDTAYLAALTEYDILSDLIEQKFTRVPIALDLIKIPEFSVLDMQFLDAPTLYEKINGTERKGQQIKPISEDRALEYLLSAQEQLGFIQEYGWRRYKQDLPKLGRGDIGDSDIVFREGVKLTEYKGEVRNKPFVRLNRNPEGRSLYYTNEIECITIAQFEAYCGGSINHIAKKNLIDGSAVKNRVLVAASLESPKYDSDGNPRNVITYDDGSIAYLDFHFRMVECGLKDWVKQWQNGKLFLGKKFEEAVRNVDYEAWKSQKNENDAGYQEWVKRKRAAEIFLRENNYITTAEIETNLLDRGLLLQRMHEAQTELEETKRITDQNDPQRAYKGGAANRYLKEIDKLIKTADIKNLREANFFYGNPEFKRFVSEDARNKNLLWFDFMSSLVHEFYIGYEARNFHRAETQEKKQAALNRMLYHQLWAKVADDRLIHDKPEYMDYFNKSVSGQKTPYSISDKDYSISDKDISTIQLERQGLDLIGKDISKFYKLG